jgi:hypothetical protein
MRASSYFAEKLLVCTALHIGFAAVRFAAVSSG